MVYRFLTLVVCLAVICAGCAMESKPPESTMASIPAVEESGKLPGFYGPLDRNHKTMKDIEAVFDKIKSLRNANHFTVSELQAISSGSRFSPAAISGCDLEVLKVLIASNLVPIVIIRSPVGPNHARAVIRYDDPVEQLTLADPLNPATRSVFQYSVFLKQWEDLQKTCLLVFSEYMGEQRIENILRKYLSEEKMASINITAYKRK